MNKNILTDINKTLDEQHIEDHDMRTSMIIALGYIEDEIEGLESND